MFKSKLVFKAIDYAFSYSQNVVKFKETAKIASDIVYWADEPSCCTLDIYSRKDAPKKQPLFINIHGGGYVAGDKKYRRSFSGCVANEGWIVVNLNYGLSPKYPFPDFLRHICKAMLWIEQNADKYGFDLDNVVISGDSAGAHMAAAICVIGYDEDYRKALGCDKFNVKIKSAVLFCGSYEPTLCLTNDIILKLNRSLCTDVIGIKDFSEENIRKYKFFKELDITNYVTKDFPPSFVTHTFNDIFCLGHGPRFVAKLRENKVGAHEVISRDDMHDWHENMATKSAKVCMAKFYEYLKDIRTNNPSINSDDTMYIKKGAKEE